MSGSVQIDRQTYALARARGHQRYEAARRAGSDARGIDNLCRVASRLEADPEVRALIAAERERLKVETDDEWATVLVTMHEDVSDPDPKVRRAAADFFARIGGRYQDKPLISTGPTLVLTADAVEALARLQGSAAGRFALTEGAARLIEGADAVRPEEP